MADRKDNLIPEAHKLTAEDRVKGGKTRAENQRRQKQLREEIQALLDAELSDDRGNIVTGSKAMALKAFQQALKGDWRAWELVRDTSGQKPVEKVVYAEIDPDVISEVEALVEEDEN